MVPYHSCIQLLDALKLMDSTDIRQLNIIVIQYHNYTTSFSIIIQYNIRSIWISQFETIKQLPSWCSGRWAATWALRSWCGACMFVHVGSTALTLCLAMSRSKTACNWLEEKQSNQILMTLNYFRITQFDLALAVAVKGERINFYWMRKIWETIPSSHHAGMVRGIV